MNAAVLRLLRWVDVHVFGSRQCSVCGCTEHTACPGGCSWSMHTLFGFRDDPVCTRCL